MEVLIVVVLFLSILLGAVATQLLKINDLSTKLLLSFSGAYLLSITFINILPEIFSFEAPINLGFFVLIGFLLQLFLESFSKGLEHGHHHPCDKEHQINISPSALLIGVGLHSFFEAMPFAHHFAADHSQLQNSLLIGIIIHNLPISIVLMSLFLSAGYSLKKSYIYIVIVALSAPLGVLVSSVIGNNITENIDQYFHYLMALVVGIFLHISTTILFESESNHRMKFMNWLVIFVGIFVAALSQLIH